MFYLHVPMLLEALAVMCLQLGTCRADMLPPAGVQDCSDEGGLGVGGPFRLSEERQGTPE